MMKNKQTRNANQKKPYTKPEVKQVQLRPEEAVLGFCKTTSASVGPLQALCTSPTPCSTQGS